MQLRLATTEDVSSLKELTLQLGYSVTESEMHARFNQMCDVDRYQIWVAQVKDQVVAWMVLEKLISLEGGTRLEITGFVVSSQFRRQGIGQALIHKAKQIAHSMDQKLVVRSNVNRVESHPFYLAQGFTCSKSQHVYQWSE